MKKIRFTKDFEVDYWDASYNEVNQRFYRRGTTVEITDIETVDKNHVNLHLGEGDLLVDIPKNSFVIVS